MSKKRPARTLALTRGHFAAAVAIAVACGLIAGLSWAFSEKLVLSRQLRLEEARLELMVEAEAARHGALLAQREHVKTDEFVEEWARTGPRMGKPGERIVVPVRPAVEPSPTPALPVYEVEASEESLWLDLLELVVGPSGHP